MTAAALAVLGVLAAAAGLALAVTVLSARLMIVTVQGSSMAPTYAHRDRLLIRRGRRPRRWDAIVFRPAGWDASAGPPYLVKRLVAGPGDPVPADMRGTLNGDVVPDGCLVVRGDSDFSLDSRHLGYIPVAGVLGVVIRPLGSPGPSVAGSH